MKKAYILLLFLTTVSFSQEKDDIFDFDFTANYIVDMFNSHSKDSKIVISEDGEIEITQLKKCKFNINWAGEIVLINDDLNIPAIRFKADEICFLNISEIPKNKREKLLNAFKNLQKVIIRDNRLQDLINEKSDDVFSSPQESKVKKN